MKQHERFDIPGLGDYYSGSLQSRTLIDHPLLRKKQKIDAYFKPAFLKALKKRSKSDLFLKGSSLGIFSSL